MEIDAPAVRRQLGIQKAQDNHAIERVIAIELAAAKTLFEPKQASRDAKLLKIDGAKLFFEGLTIESKSLASHLKGCEKATFFAVTMGGRIDAEIKDHLENDETPQAMVMDAIGSVACESLAQQADDEITQMAKDEGYLTTTRVSPGYGDWKIEGQQDLLKLLNAEKVGITLTSSFLMLPSKSITAAKGWRKP